ncbi:class C sortase [Bacillus gaemokensis]|uniref:Sortase n=1 Tax=Bacillus gaemokensis TaxID=574375 RepID=A0A073KPT3_9BACI|nr:class C sortase [Bacillus gaemokensis]KEK24388.1 sortase [Bacillus gaemokensis]KYG38363.1 sortase [Bacillus gaemokensis]
MKRNIIFGCVFLLGLSIFLYPTVSNWLATRAHYSEVSTYDEKVKALQKEEIERREREAEEYNKKIQNENQSFSDPFNEGKNSDSKSYIDVLNLGEVMGYVEIPKIDVKLPIYHGTSEEVLSRGVGHIEKSSLPVGGESTHTILTGHRGLPSAVLFTDLDKLVESDIFYIHSLDKVLAYQVDQIKVALPNETADLAVVKEKDYATLITCTPYGVNTHRLLIRGHRVPYNSKEKEAVSKSKPSMIDKKMIVASGVIVGGLVLFIYMKRRKKRKQGK